MTLLSRNSNRAHTTVIPSLNGLRGLSVLIVWASHLLSSEPLWSNHLTSIFRLLLEHLEIGRFGVDVFFVISGFLITNLLLVEYERTRAINFTVFYVRRVFRIFPPYFVYLTVVAIISAVGDHPLPQGALSGAFLFVSNYISYYKTRPDLTGWRLGHTWSLSLEEQFYLFWPSVLLYALRTKHALAAGLLIVSVVPFLRLFTDIYDPSLQFDFQIYRLFHTSIDIIMSGCLLAVANRSDKYRPILTNICSTPAIIICCLYISFSTTLNRILPWWYRPFAGITITTICITGIVFYSISRHNSAWGRLLAAPIMSHIGAISYSLYLWQQLFVGPFSFVRFPFNILATVICAEASHFAIEKPSFVLRDAFQKKYLARIGT